MGRVKVERKEIDYRFKVGAVFDEDWKSENCLRFYCEFLRDLVDKD